MEDKQLDLFERKKKESIHPAYSAEGYSLGHPWYYRNGGEVLCAKDIVCGKMFGDDKENKKQCKDRQAVIDDFNETVRKYEEIRINGIKAISEYDITMSCACYERNKETGRSELNREESEISALSTALALCHNHVSNAKARMKYIGEEF